MSTFLAAVARASADAAKLSIRLAEAERERDEARQAARRLLADGILFEAEQAAFVAEYPWLAEAEPR